MIDQRINQIKDRIQDHAGDDSDLRKRLQQLKARRAQQTPAAPTPTPWSGQYESTVGNLRRQRDNTMLGIDASEIAAKKTYGFEDTSDPFSRANQLQQNFANANRGTLNNYASAGQLYAGSLSNARDIDRQNFEQRWDAEQKAYQDTLNQLAQRRLEATTDYEGDVLEAEARRLEAAAEERVDPAEAPAQQGKNKKQDKPKQNKKKGK